MTKALDLEDLAKPAVIRADRPFAGSPAEKFGDGVDAIVIPEAKRVGRFSAKDVDFAYRKTKAIIAGAYLDRATLLGGKPEAFAKALHPEQRKVFWKLLDHKNHDKNSRSWVVSFGRGEAELVGDTIKVQGTLSAAEGKDENGDPELWIKFDYRFVYAVRKPGTQLITRVMVLDKAPVSFWRSPGERRLDYWLGDSEKTLRAGVQCKWDGYEHPDYSDPHAEESAEPGPTLDPYAEQSGSADDDPECVNVDDV